MTRRRYARTSLKRTEVIDALVGVRALMLNVPRRDLMAAIRLTAPDHLTTLVTVDGRLACSLADRTEH